MELRHLRYFVAVAEELSFSRAARKLNISQPPLTRQIKNLEDEIGTLLFARTKRKVTLTPAGKTFLKKAREVLFDANKAMEETLRIAHGMSDTIRLAFMSSVMLAEFPPILAAFHKDFPQVSFDFVQMKSIEQVEALLDKRIDVGFVDLGMQMMSEKFKVEHVNADIIMHEKLLAAVPKGHRLEKKEVISLYDLRHDEFAILERHYFPSNYDTVISACREAGFSPNIVYHGDQVPTVLAYVASSMGVCLAPECAMSAWSKHISFIPLNEQCYVDIHMITNGRNVPAVIQSFREYAVKFNLQHGSF